MRPLAPVAFVIGIALLILAVEVRGVLRSDPAQRPAGNGFEAIEQGGDAQKPRPDSAPSSPVPLSPAPQSAQSAQSAHFEQHFSWSSGVHGLGRVARQEGNPEGPAGLAVNALGTSLIVDSVNHRLLFTAASGDTLAAPSPLREVCDVAALPNGSFAVLDRLADRAAAIVDSRGKLLAKLPLPPHAGDPGLLTGIFADARNVCVEKEHGECVPVFTNGGEPVADAAPLHGRPASDGVSLLHAGIVAPPSARMHLTRSWSRPFRHGYTRELLFPSTIQSLHFLDANAAGELFLAVVLAGAPAELLVLCMTTETGVELGRTVLPTSPLPDEVTRELTVISSGGFAYLHRTMAGAALEYHACVP